MRVVALIRPARFLNGDSCERKLHATPTMSARQAFHAEGCAGRRRVFVARLLACPGALTQRRWASSAPIFTGHAPRGT